MSVILLFSLILAWSTPIAYNPPIYGRSDYARVDIVQQQAILTTDNRILFLNLTDFTFEVNIVSLETNNTPVSIRAFNPLEFLDIQNVTFIDEIPLTIYSKSIYWDVWDEWGIILVRENNDVNVSIEAEVWYYDYTIVDLAPPVNLGIYGITFTFITLFWIGNLEKQCRIHKTGQKNWDRKQGPIAVIILILSASILLTPVTLTVAFHDFYPEWHGQRDYSVELTELSPSRGFYLQEIMENQYAEIGIRTFGQEVKFITEGSNDTISWVIMESSSSYSWTHGWWLLFEEDTSYENLTLSRSSTDVTAEMQVEDSWIQFAFPYYFEIPVGLALIGVLPLGLALLRAYRIDRLFSKPEDTELDYNDDESNEDTIVN